MRREDEMFLVEMEKQFHGNLVFKSDRMKHYEFFSITNVETNEVLVSRREQ